MEPQNNGVWGTMTAAGAVEPRTSRHAAVMTLRSTVALVRALLKRRCSSLADSQVMRFSVNDHEKAENIYSDKKDLITKKKKKQVKINTLTRKNKNKRIENKPNMNFSEKKHVYDFTVLHQKFTLTLRTRCKTQREIWQNCTFRLINAKPCMKMALHTVICRTYG